MIRSFVLQLHHGEVQVVMKTMYWWKTSNRHLIPFRCGNRFARNKLKITACQFLKLFFEMWVRWMPNKKIRSKIGAMNLSKQIFGENNARCQIGAMSASHYWELWRVSLTASDVSSISAQSGFCNANQRNNNKVVNSMDK
jgi:hypothetical protein